MGYSVYVVTRSKDLATKMAEHLRLSIDDEWLPNARIATNFEPPSSNLSYAQLGKNRFQVGFDFSCMGNTEHAFVWDIIKWMAKAMGLTRYCYDGCEYIKIEGVDAQSSLDRAYKMPHISRIKAAAVRAVLGPTRKEITEAKRRLRQIKDGWVQHGD